MVERKLRETGDELKRVREELRIAHEQLQFLDGEVEEARIRSMVSETPVSEQEMHEAARHADAMRRHHGELQARMTELETRQDDLLDEMMGS